ncbi:MAG: hypothetical protein ACLSAF_19420 [Intestinimonas sp.]
MSPTRAYDALIRACELGILGGMPDGTVQPSGTLTWGQYLAMLGRAFYPTVCDAHSGADSHWAMPYYLAACEAGVLQADDFLPVASDKLDMPLLRRDAAVLLSRLLPQEPASPARVPPLSIGRRSRSATGKPSPQSLPVG